MHRAIASYASGGAAPVLDDTTVLEQYGSLVERTALGREATVEEVASELGVEVEEASDMAALLEPPLPLDSILPTLASGEATDATVLRAEAVGRLTEAIEKLPERLRLVLSLHYIEDLTYREIAGILKVSEPRVCQLHTEAIGQLRKLLPDARGGGSAEATRTCHGPGSGAGAEPRAHLAGGRVRGGQGARRNPLRNA